MRIEIHRHVPSTVTYKGICRLPLSTLWARDARSFVSVLCSTPVVLAGMTTKSTGATALLSCCWVAFSPALIDLLHSGTGNAVPSWLLASNCAILFKREYPYTNANLVPSEASVLIGLVSLWKELWPQGTYKPFRASRNACRLSRPLFSRTVRHEGGHHQALTQEVLTLIFNFWHAMHALRALGSLGFRGRDVCK